MDGNGLVGLPCPNTPQRLSRSRQHEEVENGKEKRVHQPLGKHRRPCLGWFIAVALTSNGSREEKVALLPGMVIPSYVAVAVHAWHYDCWKGCDCSITSPAPEQLVILPDSELHHTPSAQLFLFCECRKKMCG